MHLKAEAILEFGESDEHQNKIIRAYRDEYKQLNSILGKQPKILELAHRDLQQLSKATSRRGRKPTFTSENLFRAILVMQREGLDYQQFPVGQKSMNPGEKWPLASAISDNRRLFCSC